MTSKRHTSANQTKLDRVQAALDAVLEEVLRNGFHGVARIELLIADGTIQRISRSVERIDK